MREKHVYFAFLAFGAIFAILLACGSGDIIDITDTDSKEYLDMINSRELLTDLNTGLIKKCVNEEYDDGCPDLTISMASTESSSSYDPDTDPNNWGNSSSSGPVTPLSSSSTPSSSSVQNDDPHGLVPDFACKWTPGEIFSGENTQISLEYASPDGVACAPVRAEHEYPISIFANATHNFNLSESITPVFGQQIASGLNWPALPSSSGGSATFAVKGVLSCTAQNESGETISGTKKSSECALTIKRPPAPVCASPCIKWAEAGTAGGGRTIGSERIFYIGETPQFTVATATTETAQFCGDVTYKTCIDNNCTVQTTNAWPSSLATTSGKQIIKVEAVCSNGETLGSTTQDAAAAVVPNPSLSGRCAWSSDPSPNSGTSYQTTIHRGATPSGVTLNNAYGRCGSGINATSQLLSASGYYGNAQISSWPANGTTGLTTTTYAGVKPNITCTPDATTPTPNTTVCKDLIVAESLSACDAEAQLANFCPGVAWENITWNTNITSSTATSSMGGKCYYINYISSRIHMNGYNNCQNANGNETNYCYILNGNKRWNSGYEVNQLPPKVDGGYYLYVPGNPGWKEAFTATGSVPYCQDRVEALNCSVPSSAATGSAIIPSTTCRSGVIPSGVVYTGSGSLNLDNPTAGTYTVNASGTCGSNSFSNVSCGSVTVVSATPLTFDGINEQNLTVGTMYNITCSNTSRPIWLLKSTNDNFEYIVNGETKTAAPYSPVNVLNGNCVTGTTLQIISSPGGNTAIKNRTQWYSD
jgi:hypothetical protein